MTWADSYALVGAVIVVALGAASAVPVRGGNATAWPSFLKIVRFVADGVAMCAWPWWFAYAFAWLTGAWLPLWVVIVVSAWVTVGLLHYGDEKKRPPAWLRTVTFYVWTSLWLAHYAPQAHFPILGAAP